MVPTSNMCTKLHTAMTLWIIFKKSWGNIWFSHFYFVSLYCQGGEMVDVLVSTQKSVEWGKLVDISQTRVIGDYIFKSVQVRILSLAQKRLELI
jgi:hypothetical protein